MAVEHVFSSGEMTEFVTIRGTSGLQKESSVLMIFRQREVVMHGQEKSNRILQLSSNLNIWGSEISGYLSMFSTQFRCRLYVPQPLDRIKGALH